MKTYNSFVCTLLLALLATTLAAAQGESSAPDVTRADLAAAYLRFDAAISEVEVEPERMAELNKTFDESTLAFFRGEYRETIRRINALTLSLMSAGEEKAVEAAMALRVSMIPRVYVIGNDPPHATLSALCDAEGLGEYEMELRLRTPSGDSPLAWPFVPNEFGHAQGVDMIGASELEPGRYEVGIAAYGDFIPAGSMSIVRESLDAVHERNAARLAEIDVEDELEQAHAAVRARNALLTDTPSDERTIEFLVDPVELVDNVNAEIEALERGEDPFDGRTGDYWRVVESPEETVPMRVYLPESAAGVDPLPLVIAFHGAGGDENHFMEAYGAGILKDLADEHKFLAVTPLTYTFRGANTANLFRLIVETLAENYPVDPDRIYILGHSMGGGVVTRLAIAMPEAIAAAVPLAGFGGFPDDTEQIPPTLVIAAEHDPLANPVRLKTLADEAIAAGLPVTYKVYANQGHTVVVGESLPHAIDWLLGHRPDAN